MPNLLRKNLLYFVSALIVVLLVVNVGFTYFNNQIIEENQVLQKQAVQVKTQVKLIVELLNDLDMGIWGYHITRDTSAINQDLTHLKQWKQAIFSRIAQHLQQQQYEVASLNQLKSSVDAYFLFNAQLKQLIDQGREQEFVARIEEKRGMPIIDEYRELSKRIQKFENEIAARASVKYATALNRQLTVQIALLAITLPTLLFTVFHIHQSFANAKKLGLLEQEKRELKEADNLRLEATVTERTAEIRLKNEELAIQAASMLIQNQELAAQKEAVLAKNELLQSAQTYIQAQNIEIEETNKSLEQEIFLRTQELTDTNRELTQRNYQLEQFAYITSHNLRGPAARLLGLGQLVDLTTLAEREEVITKLRGTTQELDLVIRDLAAILEVQHDVRLATEIHLPTQIQRVKLLLESEICKSGAQIGELYSGVDAVHAFAPYLDSILYNLFSNALKYRHPNRAPFILFKAEQLNNLLCLSVTDNGLGIDLETYGNHLRDPNEWFHAHAKGKGMGLYLVKFQAEALGGHIEIDSGESWGTSFRIFLAA